MLQLQTQIQATRRAIQDKIHEADKKDRNRPDSTMIRACNIGVHYQSLPNTTKYLYTTHWL